MVDRDYITNKMKGRMLTPAEFDFDKLQAPPLYSLLTEYDINQLHKLATSIRYAAKPLERMKGIDDILRNRGFVKFAGGTNRVVYRFLEDDRFVLKVATDAVGVKDNPREYFNQQFFKPFVAKTFEVSPCGTVGLAERVIPITSREEFLSVADDVYDLVTNIFTGKFVVDDIGTHAFMNYGIRRNFGVVLLDYPYIYMLDGNKLYCNRELDNGEICKGIIDYDEGYNHLRCTKCGKQYKAIDLKKDIDNSIVKQEGGLKMKVELRRGDWSITNDSDKFMDTTPRLVSRRGKKSKVGSLTLEVKRGDRVINTIGGGATSMVTENEDNCKFKVNISGGSLSTPVVEEEPEVNIPEEIKVDTVDTTPTVIDMEVPEDTKPIVGHVEIETVISKEHEEVDWSDPENWDISVAYGSIINSDEIGDDDPIKCIIAMDDAGGYINYKNSYLIITEIDGRAISDIVMLEKSAYEKLIDSIEEYKKNIAGQNDERNKLSIERVELETENTDLKSEVEVLNKKLSELNEGFESLMKNYEDLREDNKNLQNKLDAYKSVINSEKKSSSEDYDTTSPLIKSDEEEVESIEDIKAEINDQELVKKIDSIFPDDVPVGAAPPRNNSKTVIRSARKDPNFYNNNTSNKGSKKKK